MKQLSAILITCLLVACSKRDVLIEVDQNYIGLWGLDNSGSCGEYINIPSSGNSQYYEGGTSFNCKEKVFGKGIAKTDGDCLFIGSCKLPIKAAPVYNTTTKLWTMQLEIDNSTKQLTKIQ